MVFQSDIFSFSAVLPGSYAKSSMVTKKVLHAYQTGAVSGFSKFKCSSEYLRLLIPFPYYGSTFFSALIPPILSDDIAFHKSLEMMRSSSFSFAGHRGGSGGGTNRISFSALLAASNNGVGTSGNSGIGGSTAAPINSNNERLSINTNVSGRISPNSTPTVSSPYSSHHPDLDRQVYVGINSGGVQLIRKSNSTLILSISFESIKTYEINKQKTAFFMGYITEGMVAGSSSSATQRQLLLHSQQVRPNIRSEGRLKEAFKDSNLITILF